MGMIPIKITIICTYKFIHPLFLLQLVALLTLIAVILLVISLEHIIGQTHHMFSRFLNPRIYDFFTIFSLFCFSPRYKFSIDIKNADITAHYYNRKRNFANPLKNEISWKFVDSGFVKTCHELDNRCGRWDRFCFDLIPFDYEFNYFFI